LITLQQLVALHVLLVETLPGSEYHISEDVLIEAITLGLELQNSSHVIRKQPVEEDQKVMKVTIGGEAKEVKLDPFMVGEPSHGVRAIGGTLT